MNNLKIFGRDLIDDKCIDQIKNCISDEDLAVLTADAHYGEFLRELADVIEKGCK